MSKQLLISFLLSLIIGFSACKDNQSNELIEKQKAAVIKIFQIFDNGNVDELEAIIAADAIDHQLDTSITKKQGVEGIMDYFRYFHKIFPDMKTTIHSIAVSNDTVFAHSTSIGTASESFMGMSANQQHTISGVDIIRFEGDKAVEHWGFIDIAALSGMMQNQMMGNSNDE
jgi:predicted SnoaL-like aldol condensation-catalyzing enzyme